MSCAAQLACKTLVFSPEIALGLGRLSLSYPEAPQSVLVAAAVALLSRYAGRDEIALAAVARDGASRVVQVRLDGDPDSQELFRRVAVALSSAARSEGNRIEQFVPGAKSAIEVCVTLDAPAAFAPADLTLNVSDRGLELLFRTQHFEAGAIERIAEHLRALLVGLVENPGPISAIPLVYGEERAWILDRSNVRAVKLDEDLPSFVECVERQAQKAPQALALITGSRSLTYRQLAEAASTLCQRLRARGVGSGVNVAIYLERGPDAVIALLAILKAGGTYVPLDTSYPVGRVAAIMARAAPGLLVTQASAVPAIGAFSSSDAPPTLLIDHATDEMPVTSASAAGAASVVQPDDAAYVLFTSGSTGQPKGVVVEQRALSNYVRSAVDAYGLHAGDRVLQAASLGFDLSLEEVVITLTCGATLVVRSAPPIESVQAFFEECVEQRLTVLSITSALWHELTMRLADGTVVLPPLLRLVILGADAARPDVLVQWQRATGGRVRLVNTYGLTETTIVATTWEAGGQTLANDWRALPIGRPLRNVSAYVLDSYDQLAPVGVAGEICIGGLAVAREYLGDDALTRARFAADPYLAGGLMYRSGDRGILRSSGELEFLGRADYQIKVRGVRIELGEVESRLREFPGVIEAVAIPWKNHMAETEIHAQVLVSGPEVTPARLRAHLERVLPAAAVPARVHVADRFPLTPAGKIDRRALAESTRQLDRAEFVAAQTPLQKLVVSTLAEILGDQRVGLEDTFLALGGSSLSAVRAASLLGPRLGLRLRSQLFLEPRTLAEICAELERGDVGPRDLAPLLHLLETDAMLDPGIVVSTPPKGSAPLGSVLVTGATGYYGAFVLAELLRETEANIVCLVRAQTPEAARARVEQNLARLGCAVEKSVFRARVSCLCGDMAEPDFGLSPQEFHGLSERLDAVFHIAAQVSMLLPYEVLRANNALAVHSVLKLATTGRPKTVHHVSTVEVLTDTDRRAAGALSERGTADSPALLDGGYAQSKWVAEKLIEQARQRGVTAYIYRAGRLSAHSSSGAFNEHDFLVRLLDACGQVGAAPVLDLVVDMTPVDVASRALVLLAKTAPSQATFHLVHPRPPMWASLVEIIIGLGYPLRTVSHSQWRALLNGVPVRETGATFLQYLAGLSQTELEASIRGGYESKAVSAALGSAFAWPRLDAELFATYLGALRGAGRFGLAPLERNNPQQHGAAGLSPSRYPP
jgi:myxalamid-type nonribosomal peptide synthetase MxaA